MYKKMNEKKYFFCPHLKKTYYLCSLKKYNNKLKY